MLCNPPFFTQHMASGCPRRHQARHNDGLSFDELAGCASRLLTEEGTFHVLLPESEHQRFLETCEPHGLFLSQHLSVHPTDHKTANRVILSLRKSRQKVRNEKMCIHTPQGYSQKFVNYLQPFYLKL